MPSLKFWVTEATFTPSPTFELENTSANETEPALKPLVSALAMLLPITSRLLDAAFNPLTACEKLIDTLLWEWPRHALRALISR